VFGFFKKKPVIKSAWELMGCDGARLEELYRGGTAGIPPRGSVKGLAILAPGSRFNQALSRAAAFVWKGKYFERDSAINRWLGVRLFTAKVYKGESWLDGKPAIVLDYAETSRVVGFVRGEIREIFPRVFLGLEYLRTKPKPKLALFFALEPDA
jgi:hypothetical protein